MSYKLITFDFTGTLMRFRIPPPIQYAKIASLYGIEIKNKEAFHSNFKKAFKSVNNEHPNFGASTNLHWYIDFGFILILSLIHIYKSLSNPYKS